MFPDSVLLIFGYELHDVGDVDRSVACDGPQVDSELAVKLCCKASPYIKFLDFVFGPKCRGVQFTRPSILMVDDVQLTSTYRHISFDPTDICVVFLRG